VPTATETPSPATTWLLHQLLPLVLTTATYFAHRITADTNKKTPALLRKGLLHQKQSTPPPNTKAILQYYLTLYSVFGFNFYKRFDRGFFVYHLLKELDS
jgi:hypothetical protein